ncbi:type II toxin-antitoxin system RelE/ParE family toxin [Microvirga sp. Mcv34]|uniref:type II toxin-antitoxin system RelE/ParE family toxin n=1 Tax=Microvirga sp. Mcv34 TaxID=2926016 RepID=UPI0021C7FB79|nr:type II toxin-antitoxin system RelE/ParE family toxin [Microvirga sp. Mcv34]
MRLEWHSLAEEDLASIVVYIANDDPEAAYRVHDEIAGQVAALARHPLMGREGRVAGTRELPISRTGYVVAYRVGEDAVTVLRVFHGARKWPDTL